MTGAAGFIGSTLCEALRARGDEVLAVDCYTPYYARAVKVQNSRAFDVVDVDLRTTDLRAIVAGADAVFHFAAQPGVRASWHDGFDDCESHNVLATQRLLEAAVTASVPRVVFASSSSVYGAAAGEVEETSLLRPRSPYGVTKLAAEHLCAAYAEERGLAVRILRLFTVYGPRQRPDMAIHRLIESALGGAPFPMYGDGTQRRDFTYVDDVVRAACLAADADPEALGDGAVSVINIAGGSTVELNALVGLVADCVGEEPKIERNDRQAGDVPSTAACTSLADRRLGWRPEVGIEEGVAAQVEWHRARGRS